MKDFMKMVGATILGILLTSIVMFLFAIIGLAGVTASEGTTSVDDNTILRINLNGTLSERSEANPLALLNGGNEGLALDEILEAIEKAAKNDDVLGIYLEGGNLSGSPAMLQELRQALVRFKKESKKFVVAYADTYSQSSYYVCSMADEVALNPSGQLDWHGLGAELMFYTDVMKKLGIKMQVYKVGTFKSAVEPFINTEMSEPNRQQVTSYLTSIWNNMLKDVAADRKISADRLNALADTMLTFATPDLLLKEKMIDRVNYKDEVRDFLKEKVGFDEDDQLVFASPAVMAHTTGNVEKHSDCIAVYYAYGDIVDNLSTGLNGGGEGGIAPEPMNTELQKLLKDKSIKAVVIRVNSGGGSAYASEQIWRQISLLKAEKPVVISMGGMAASGGYYISCNASRIVAEPTTITGSIGIFGMIPDASELLTEKIGLHYDMVKTNKHGDFGTMSRPMNEDEGRIVQRHVEQGYDLFTRRVAEGRKISQDSVKVIGEGRVWTGEQALKIGLVDELGDLQTAIKAAAKLAKISDYCLASYPAPKSWFEQLLGNDDDQSGFLESQLKNSLGEWYEPFQWLRDAKHQNPIQARMPYHLIIRN